MYLSTAYARHPEILSVCDSTTPTREIVLLHGMTGSPEELLPAAKILAESCNARVWLPKLKGHDNFQSLRTVPAQAWLDQVLDVVETIRGYSCNNLSLIGVSFGGILAAFASERLSAHVDSLVLLAPPWRIRSRIQELQLLLLRLLPEFVLNLLWKHEKAKVPLVLPRKCFSHHWVGAIVRLVRIRSHIRPESISVRTMIISDPRDHQISESSLEDLVKRLPRGRLIFISDGTHELLLGKKYVEVLEIIAKFITES